MSFSNNDFNVKMSVKKIGEDVTIWLMVMSKDEDVAQGIYDTVRQSYMSSSPETVDMNISHENGVTTIEGTYIFKDHLPA